MKKSIQLMVLGLALCCTLLAQAAKPVFLITPVTKAPSTIYAGQTVTTTYTITNNTPYALDGNGVVELPTGVTQAGGSCNTPFNLASGASCTLTLQIVADTLTGDVRGGPKVCNTLANPIYCSRPSLGNELNITKSTNQAPITSFTISGSISGLTASGLVLQNNGTDDLVVPSGSTSFEFATPVTYGDGYVVTVATQPTGLTCTVSNGTGTNVTTNINSVSITCNTTTFTIGGSISGLTASGLVLRNNGTDNLVVPSGSTSFQFATPVAYGGGYAVTIATQPTGRTCTVSNGTGTNVMANINTVSITCNVTTFTVGGTITGLTDSGLVLRNNGGDDLTVPSGATSFQFATPVAYGSGYAVTVATQPPGVTCTVNNGTGSNVTANVTNVQIVCTVQVGDALGGGVVYQIVGSTAYVVSLGDVNTSVAWDTDVSPSSVATSDSNGYGNTYVILVAANFTAAAACRTYNPGVGSGEWFLLAANEWPILGNTSVLTAINAKSGKTGFIQFSGGVDYWGSTQRIGNSVFTRSFASSSLSFELFSSKDSTLRVRCVRTVPI